MRSALKKQGPIRPAVARFEVPFQARGGIYGWGPGGATPRVNYPSQCRTLPCPPGPLRRLGSDR
jgi:hypothetical protein